ncbi:MAG: SUMF1/EgtB/PvdO family nonheme iron enzyme [Planctomycetota bacterium]|jgi:formylglycine-generating enzyme required for sulfatase activity
MTERRPEVALISLALAATIVTQAAAMQAKPPMQKQYINPLGMTFVRIRPGVFQMGRLNPADPLNPGYSFVVDGGDWDEKPVHRVTITRPFYIQQTEVTADQYRKFDPAYSASDRYATGITWHEAVAFAKWLSKKEKKPYRLPTEAEWEYVCRAGTTTLFSSGHTPPQPETKNPWAVRNMHTGPAEWVLDWHATYLPDHQTDPLGPAAGMVKVIRGARGPCNARSAGRWSMPPDAGRRAGFNDFGFRLVMGPLPKTKPLHVVPFPQECVKQSAKQARLGPNPDLPYFNRRPAMPIPPENDQDDIGPLVGVHPAVLAHNHSPGFTALPNGDLLAVYFSSSTATTESETNTTFVQARLRHGADQWDMPEVFIDFANMNDQSALLWNDNGTIWFFGGGRGWPEKAPFKYTTSTDNAATWHEIKLPVIEGEPGRLTPQPITSAFRDPDGNIYFNMDGSGARSLLWRSADQGKTWTDMGGRTEGRHSAILPIKDDHGQFSGTLLCLGTKKGHFAGNWMQQNISHDWGKTWQPKTRAPFPYLSSNQRGCLRRLASGKLIFVSDHQAREGRQPEGYTKRGCLVAISADEGKNWRVKTLPATLPHEGRVIKAKRKWTNAGHDDGTVGYVSVAQTPNGIIHILTTMNHPCLHFEFNEAWLYSDAGGDLPPDPGDSGKVRTYKQHRLFAKPKTRWGAKICDDGRYLLHGTETWYYNNGRKQYEVTYKNGRKTGDETYWTPDGKKRWNWNHYTDGSGIWTHFWPHGRKKSMSNWVNLRCEGTATSWDRMGNVTSQIKLRNGVRAD